MNDNRCPDCGRFHSGQCANERHCASVATQPPGRNLGVVVRRQDGEVQVKRFGGLNRKRS